MRKMSIGENYVGKTNSHALKHFEIFERHTMNSQIACSYERFELADVRLFRTADFDCSRSGSLRTVFGARLRLLFAIGSGLHCRGEKRDPVPDLLTSRAFMRN